MAENITSPGGKKTGGGLSKILAAINIPVAACFCSIPAVGIILILALLYVLSQFGILGNRPFLSGPLSNGAISCNVAYPVDADEGAMANYINSIIPSGSPLSGLGANFVATAKAGNKNPLFVAFFAKKESSWGVAGWPAQNANNPFGRKAGSGQPSAISPNGAAWYNFSSFAEAIDKQGPFLKSVYQDQGLHSIEQIINKYAPSSDGNDPNGYAAQANAFIAENSQKAGNAFGTDPCAISVGEMVWPVPSVRRISSKYGLRISPISKIFKKHHGIDIPAASGTEIVAAAPGTAYGFNPSWCGNQGVVIDHGGGLKTRYCHNQTRTIEDGQQVSAGEKIATVNSAGNSTGNHLHFEIRVDEKSVDPCIRYLSCP